MKKGLIMETKEYKDIAEKYVLHTYNRFPLVLERGEGVYLFDTDGNKYLDFAAGIAVYSLGYGNKEINDAMKAQIDKICHTSNLFYHEQLGPAAAKLVKATGLSKAFFTNSGTEAVEGAIKAAKKYAWNKTGSDESEIIAMNGSFHGRSVGALSVTGNPHYHDGFRPLMGGVRFADYNDIDSVKALINDKTCAVILETIQGEGGIYPADPDFIKEIRNICDEKDIVLILDEIQCGMGRSGYMWAYEAYGIKPDIVTVAKAMGNGVPVGAFVIGEKVAQSTLVPGDHGTTYGGNPFALSAVNKVFDIYEKENIVDHVKEISEVLDNALAGLKEKCRYITDIRGMGLIRGIQFDPGKPVGEVITKARDNGLIVISAENNVLRLVPPLIIEKKHVDEMTEILERVLSE